MTKPIALIIMDGLAYGAPVADPAASAVAQAETPRLDELWAKYPHTLLDASGPAVGLPAGQMGNSEVGHLNIGAGRCVYQELTRLDRAIADGSLQNNRVLTAAIDHAVDTDHTVHLMGLVSDGGVHSHINHLKALIQLARARGAHRVRVHAFLDGRDVPPTSGADYVAELSAFIDDIPPTAHPHTTPDIRIATVMGRYWAMDRDRRWDRVQRAYDALTAGIGTHVPAAGAVAAIRDSYAAGITDEFVEPIIVGDTAPLTDGDTCIFFNFRPDRARQITRALVDDDFDAFERHHHPELDFVCLCEYDPTIDAPVAFPKEIVTDTLADVIAAAGLRQLHIAETEKYAHVTFFLNGGTEQPKPGEMRTLIPSPQVATYDLQPEMSAPAVGDSLVQHIESDAADVYIVNFANGDMVGHTGNLQAATRAVAQVDTQTGRVWDALRQKNGILLVTADHGNAEQMRQTADAPENTAGEEDVGTPVDRPHTAHTVNPVPLIVAGSGVKRLADGGTLADIAPTLVARIGLDVPKEWTGRDLVVE
ncbi:MAG: 2,3-bisphosphoglycerate-independent phosphoglycerate mutase [Actinomycetes bacterium]|jgi:2,3-bisphosphoglycerate-independent phosphoglycerate mutase|nr:2,3-bisphosphoglycerate-independent phosphoglycerate mutase [Actinomycetes bacterium]